jgi:hypothetical protein
MAIFSINGGLGTREHSIPSFGEYVEEQRDSPFRGWHFLSQIYPGLYISGNLADTQPRKPGKGCYVRVKVWTGTVHPSLP